MLLKAFNESLRWHAIIVCWPLYAAVFKTKIFYEDERTKENRRIKGGAMIVSNHFSGLDYMITVYKYFGRKVFVVMLENVFNKSWFLRWCLDIIGAIRADRESKRMRFMDESVRVLKRGRLLQIYPEADSTPDGTVQEFKPTYLLIALRAGAPIVPLVVDGRYGITKRAHAIVGKTIDLREYCSAADPSRE